MSIASKLFGIWAVSRTVSSATPMFMRLLAGIAAITVCAVLAAIIILLLVAGSIWLAYGQLTAYGMDTYTVILVIEGLLLALLASVMLAARNHYYRLRTTSRNVVLTFRPPTGERISRAIDAFMQGFDSGQPLR